MTADSYDDRQVIDSIRLVCACGAQYCVTKPRPGKALLPVQCWMCDAVLSREPWPVDVQGNAITGP